MTRAKRWSVVAGGVVIAAVLVLVFVPFHVRSADCGAPVTVPFSSARDRRFFDVDLFRRRADEALNAQGAGIVSLREEVSAIGAQVTTDVHKEIRTQCVHRARARLETSGGVVAAALIAGVVTTRSRRRPDADADVVHVVDTPSDTTLPPYVPG
jgi:hypothetical protein